MVRAGIFTTNLSCGFVAQAPEQVLSDVLEAQVSVDVERGINIRMTHDVLELRGAHAAPGHLGTERMTAYMGRDLGNLLLVGPVVLVQSRYNLPYRIGALFSNERSRDGY